MRQRDSSKVETDTAVVDLRLRGDLTNAKLESEKELAIVPGVTHLLEEPGTLEEVPRLTSEWLVVHLESRSS